MLLKELQSDSPSEIQHALSVKCCQKAIFNAQGSLLFCCDIGGGVIIWNVNCRRVEKKLLLADPQYNNLVGTKKESIYDIDLPSPKSGSAIVVALKQKIMLIDVKSERVLSTVTFPDSILSIACHPIKPNGLVTVHEYREPVMIMLQDGEYSCENDIASNERSQWKLATKKNNSVSFKDCSDVSYAGICHANELLQCSIGYVPQELLEAKNIAARPVFAVAFMFSGLLIRSGPTGSFKVFQVINESEMSNITPKCLVWLCTGLTGSPRLAVSCTNSVVGAYTARSVVLFRQGFFDEITSKEILDQACQALVPVKYTQSELSHRKHMVLRFPDQQNCQNTLSSDICLGFSGDGNLCYSLYSNNLESTLICWNTKTREKDFDCKPRGIMTFVCAHPWRPEFLTFDNDGAVYWWKHAFVEHWPAFCYNFKPLLACLDFEGNNPDGRSCTDVMTSSNTIMSALTTTDSRKLDVFKNVAKSPNTRNLKVAFVPFFLPCRPQCE